MLCHRNDIIQILIWSHFNANIDIFFSTRKVENRGTVRSSDPMLTTVSFFSSKVWPPCSPTIPLSPEHHGVLFETEKKPNHLLPGRNDLTLVPTLRPSSRDQQAIQDHCVEAVVKLGSGSRGWRGLRGAGIRKPTLKGDGSLLSPIVLCVTAYQAAPLRTSSSAWWMWMMNS